MHDPLAPKPFNCGNRRLNIFCAMFVRRCLLFIRGWKRSLLVIIGSDVFCGSSIILYYLINYFIRCEPKNGNFYYSVFALFAPILCTCGLCSLVTLIIFNPVHDRLDGFTEILQTTGASIYFYWLAFFLFDIIVWFFTSTLIFITFLICQIRPILQNMGIVCFVFLTTGPAFIFFTYCINFIFTKPESCAIKVFIFMTVSMIFPFIVYLLVDFRVIDEDEDKYADVTNIFLSLIPHFGIQRILTHVLCDFVLDRKSFSDYFTDDVTRSILIVSLSNSALYSILFFILLLAFCLIRKNCVSVSNNSDYAIQCNDIIMKFRDKTAVDSVSLSVPKNSIFGLLGTNGAGKTTLMRIIASLQKPTSGNVTIDNYLDNSHKISYCQQFNAHLDPDLTPEDHFKYYGMIFGYESNALKEKVDKLVGILNMDQYLKRATSKLSGSEQRKVCIALTFLNPSPVVILDEPTASLDPVARRNIRELILSFKNEKTFFICTHLLSEAELLCDTICIMTKGKIFEQGSPQSLSAKYLKDFRIDIDMDDDDPHTLSKIDNFFNQNLRDAKLVMERCTSRIYSFPANVYDYADLFGILERGRDSDNGYKLFTCSSSSLEKVYLEIIYISEMQDQM